MLNELEQEGDSSGNLEWLGKIFFLKINYYREKEHEILSNIRIFFETWNLIFVSIFLRTAARNERA